MSHTPGPWRIIENSDSAGTIVGTDPTAKLAATLNFREDELAIGLLYDANHRGTQNAHLIAAAPDLLAAMKGAMQYLDETLGPCEDDCECLLHSFHAAIAKAEGR